MSTPTTWTITEATHGTFLMHGNYCVARLHDQDPKELGRCITVSQDLLSALDQIDVAACYASEEDPDAARAALLHIGELARSAIAKVSP